MWVLVEIRTTLTCGLVYCIIKEKLQGILYKLTKLLQFLQYYEYFFIAALSQHPPLVCCNCELGRCEFRGVPGAEGDRFVGSRSGIVLQSIEHRQQAGHRQFRAAVDPDIHIDGSFEGHILQGRASGEGRVALRGNIAEIQRRVNRHEALTAMKHLPDRGGFAGVDMLDVSQIRASIKETAILPQYMQNFT